MRIPNCPVTVRTRLRPSICLLGLLCSAAVASATPVFTPVPTSESTVDGGLSRGIAWGDFDGDGYADLIVANTINQPEFLYRNDGRGDFTQIHEVEPTLTAGWTEGVNWVDFDNDGDLDLFAVRTKGANVLYRNDEGTLIRIDAGGLSNDLAVSSMACWGDYDDDGWLDAFVVNRQGENDALYRNVDGTYFERIRHGRLVNNGGDGRACAWGDADGDMDLDLYVGNFIDTSHGESTRQRNFFYVNEGHGRFSEVTSQSFVTDLALTYGVSWIDVDNDEDLDLFVTNIGMSETNWLYLNDGSAHFTLSHSMLERDVGPSKGHTWGDFDNDGDLDLFVANGTEGTTNINNWLYVGDPDGTFSQAIDSVLARARNVSAGTAWADFDRDGDLDLYVANWGGSDEDNVLYRNESTQSWIELTLSGTRSNRMGIGVKVSARARISGELRNQVRWMLPATGYASQNQPLIHFGLGDAQVIHELKISWPSGQTDVFHDLKANRLYSLEEGGSLTTVNDIDKEKN